MRGRYQEFRERGADVAAIGMGWPAAAADFKATFEVPFPVLVDHTKETYRALELGHGTWWSVAGPPVWWRGIKGIVSGHPTALPKQDPKQLSGVAVVEPGGHVRYVHRAANSSDNPPVDEVLAAL